MKSVNIMGKMTARDIAKNFLQYLSMIVITMLAVTLFCGFISNAATLNNTLQKYYKDSNLTDLICQYSALSDNDKEFLQSLETDALEYRIYTEGSMGLQSAKIFICAPDNTVSLPVITQGERGVLVDKHVLERDNIKIGDILKLELQISLAGNTLAADLPVTGVMTFPETADTHSYSPVYIDSDIFFKALYPDIPEAWIMQAFDSFCNQALIKTNSAAVKDEINAYYSAAEDSGFVFVSGRDSMESVVMLNNEISQSLKMIYVFPVIFMLVSVLVILSTIGPLILKERTNIGTLKSIGISDRRILFHYSFFGVVLCFIGGIIGVILGPLIIPNVLLIKYGIVYSMPSFSGIVFSPVFSAIAVLSVCALAALIGFVVCRKTTRERPADCMRPLPPKQNFFINKLSGKSKIYNQDVMSNLDTCGSKTCFEETDGNEAYDGNKKSGETCGGDGKELYKKDGRGDGKKRGENKKTKAHNVTRNIPLKTAVRNIIIKPSRAFMTIIGVTGCVALLVCSFGIGDTVNNSIEYELGVMFKYDINTTFSKDAESGFMQAVDTLKAEGKIDCYEIYKTFYMAAKGGQIKDIKILALPQTPVLTTVNPDGKTLISKSVAQDLKIAEGDTVTLSASGKSYSLVIDGIIETSFTKGIFITDTGVFDETYHTMGMWIKTDYADGLVDYINSINGTAGALTVNQLRTNANTTISSITTIKLTMMIFSIALAVVVLYNLSLLNIKERSRDIATMKVLGFSTWEVGRSLLYEIMMLVFVGTIAGLLLGYPMTMLVMSVNRVEALTFIYKIKPLSYIISALVSLGTALFINILFARPIKKINMTESLKSVE